MRDNCFINHVIYGRVLHIATRRLQNRIDTSRGQSSVVHKSYVIRFTVETVSHPSGSEVILRAAS